MGTEINIRVERKQDDIWVESESDKNFYDGRSYDLFSALADVRQSVFREKIGPILPLRGWPEDSPSYHNFLIDEADSDHVLTNHTWYTVQEINDWWKANHDKRIVYKHGDGITSLGETYADAIGLFFELVKETFGEEPENVRILLRFIN